MRRHLCCVITLCGSIAGHSGCADPNTITDLKKRVAALEQRNQALEAQVKALEQRAEPAPASSPLADLLGQAMRGGARGPAPGPRRTRPMDPELQKRLDRMVVDGLEKLSRSDDAKSAVKALLKMIGAGARQRPGGGLPFSPPPPAAEVSRCQALEHGVGAAITAARPCTANADCAVERFGICSLSGMHCYAAIFDKRSGRQVRTAIRAYLGGCPERQRCRCRTPEQAICLAGRCAPR